MYLREGPWYPLGGHPMILKGTSDTSNKRLEIQGVGSLYLGRGSQYMGGL